MQLIYNTFGRSIYTWSYFTVKWYIVIYWNRGRWMKLERVEKGRTIIEIVVVLLFEMWSVWGYWKRWNWDTTLHFTLAGKVSEWMSEWRRQWTALCKSIKRQRFRHCHCERGRRHWRVSLCDSSLWHYLPLSFQRQSYSISKIQTNKWVQHKISAGQDTAIKRKLRYSNFKFIYCWKYNKQSISLHHTGVLQPHNTHT